MSKLRSRLKIALNVLRGKGPTGNEPGWNVLYGTDIISDESDVWESMSAAEAEKAYANLDIVFACVRETCTTMAESTIRLGYKDGEEFKDVEHDALELVQRPNAFYDQSKLLYYQLSRLLLTGSTATWKWRSKNGNPGSGAVRELWPVPSSWVKIKTGKGGQVIQKFTVQQNEGGEQNELPVELADMMYEWLPDPNSTIGNVGILEALSHAYQVERDREDLIAETLKNLHVPGLKISTPEGVHMTPEQKRDLRAILYDKTGPGKRGSPLVLEGGADAEIMNALSDMDMPGLASMTETRICSAFGVPPILIGVRAGLENSPWSKYSEARKSFYQETMIPLWTSFEQFWTNSLLRQEGEENLSFWFDWSGIPALQEDRELLSNIGSTALKSGAITRNEYRAMLNMEPVDDGDVYLIPLTIMEQPQRAEVEIPTEEGEEE